MLAYSKPIQFSSTSCDLEEGQAISCYPATPKSNIYRYTGGVLVYYPTILIATSWDPTWRRYKTIDCSHLYMAVSDMIEAPNEGQAVICNGEKDKIYSFTDYELRYSPNPDISESNNLNWKEPIEIDCANIVIGADLTARHK